MEQMQTNLSTNVRALRERKGYDQTELAQKLGVSQVQINHVENGNRGFSVKRLSMLADLFGVTIDDLLFSDLAMADKEQVTA